ncbi:hypothetical protein EZV62_023122 [Acer yangbiense]|uniref:Myb/SANT-like domain-containing protein n=1 Tax=Acer yangbiense TaxID=1000413 RepID=A0A5C7H0M6_9ROSI|nr:hypothetical protein EZV62_023122 [Acer yangbiense]
MAYVDRSHVEFSGVTKTNYDSEERDDKEGNFGVMKLPRKRKLKEKRRATIRKWKASGIYHADCDQQEPCREDSSAGSSLLQGLLEQPVLKISFLDSVKPSSERLIGIWGLHLLRFLLRSLEPLLIYKALSLVAALLLRMDRRTFAVLCELLRNTGRLKTDGLVCIEEQVLMKGGNGLRVLQDALSRPTGMKVPTGIEMDVGGGSQINEQDRRACRRTWTKEEEETLLSIMDEIVANGGRADCGSFKAGTLKIMESRLANILPNCSLRASPHIESKVKTWKKDYGVVYDMINTSGFGWNSVRKCVEVDSNEAWHSYVQHHKQAKGWRDKPFPLYERLAYIFGKDRATGKAAYTPENLAADVDVDDNFDNDCEMPGNFSPVSVNQTDSNPTIHPTSSQPLSRKRSRSGDPIVRSMDKFANVMKNAIEKSNDTLDKFCQVLAKNKMSENQVIANDLQKMQLPLSDQVRAMQKFMHKPEVAEIFKTLQSEEQKLQFVASLLSGVFDD